MSLGFVQIYLKSTDLKFIFGNCNNYCLSIKKKKKKSLVVSFVQKNKIKKVSNDRMSLLIRYIDVKHADKLFFFFFPLFIYI
jgi:hypothetical protein